MTGIVGEKGEEEAMKHCEEVPVHDNNVPPPADSLNVISANKA